MSIAINQIPHAVLQAADARSAIIVASGEDDFGTKGNASLDCSRGVQIATSERSTESIDPQALAASADLDLSALERCRIDEGVHSITLVVAKLDRDLMREATRSLINRDAVLSELEKLGRSSDFVYVVYAVTHYNPGQRPLGPLMVNIGGDCYRTGKQISDLSSILHRTKDLAQAMLKKAVMIFPDIPALHGGKKGEWIVLDREGGKIHGLPEEVAISLGSVIIPRGIRFLNRYKEERAIAAGIFEVFPEKDYIRPDSGSPDVLSGAFWRGERSDKHINLCEVWHDRGVDLQEFTCLPPSLGGTVDPSSRPTGFGVATTTIELADRHPDLGRGSRGRLRFILEAAGGVGDSTIEALITKFGIQPRKITVFDRSIEACSAVHAKYGVSTKTLRHEKFYNKSLPEEVRASGIHYDIWINNGEGNNTTPGHIRQLLQAGVRIFTGGANNYLQVKSQEASLQAIFDAGGWAWPDAATSGGGWTLAVIDILARCQGKVSSTVDAQSRILDIVSTRNRRLVEDVLGSLSSTVDGRAIWQRVDSLMEERKEKTLDLRLEPGEVLAAADTTSWELT